MGRKNAVAYKPDVLHIDTAVPTNLKVTEDGNEYNRKEVKKERLEEAARKWADRGAEKGTGQPTAQKVGQGTVPLHPRPGATGRPAEVSLKKDLAEGKCALRFTFVSLL